MNERFNCLLSILMSDKRPVLCSMFPLGSSCCISDPMCFWFGFGLFGSLFIIALFFSKMFVGIACQFLYSFCFFPKHINSTISRVSLLFKT